MAALQLRTAVQRLRHQLRTRELHHLTDRVLLERFVRNGDQGAFAVLVERHGRLVWTVCRRVLRNEHDAEDAYQAAFLVLVRRARSIRDGQTVACWLYRVASRIARKLAMDEAKRRLRERNSPRPRQTGVVDDLSWRELQERLHDEVARLPEKYQLPFVLCCLNGQSKSEAARQLGWKEGTVSSRLAHARKQLQQRLVRRGVALGSVLSLHELISSTQAAPAGLAQATAAACLLGLHGETGALSPSVTALMEGALKTMVVSKIKQALALVSAVCLLATGTVALGWQRQPALPAHDAQDLTAGVFAEAKDQSSGSPATAAAKSDNPWIGIASRETNSGPELRVYFEGGAQGMPIPAAADTVLLAYMPDYGLGAHEVLSIDTAGTNRVLLRFAIPKRFAAEKVEMVLSRSQSKHPAPTAPMLMGIHEVTEEWDENTATWNRQPRFAAAPALTCKLDPAAKEYRIDITPLVRGRERIENLSLLLQVAKPAHADARTGAPDGWSCFGDEYVFTVDKAVRHGGNRSCRVESRTEKPTGFAMLSQTIRADHYRGERVRLSGYLKSDNLSGIATLWMRVDGKNELLAIDKTITQAVRGTTDWQRPCSVLDVPAESDTIRFAVLVEGSGKAWVNDLKLEVVDRSVPVTNPTAKAEMEDAKAKLPFQPLNLDFENRAKP
jgi:RNA polymerase sigma factor (sigma-70 family)